MAIEKYQYVTLADGLVYFVLEHLHLEEHHYLYLMEKDNMQNLGFYKEVTKDDKIRLIPILEDEELRKIQVTFLDKMKHNLETRNHE